jgi:hypothetical protein
MLIPLSVYFATAGPTQLVIPGTDRQRLLQWFWRSAFSERYSGQTNRVARADILEMQRLRSREPSNLGEFAVNIGPAFFLSNQFRIGTARTATFVLMLASVRPKSFLSGNDVDLQPVLQSYNRHEFHHMYPQRPLRSDGVPLAEINCLANMCIISRADNNKIRDKRPSEYRALMPAEVDEILRGSVATSTLFSDDYSSFRAERAMMLADVAKSLTS